MRRAFTLVELIVVIVVLAVLSGVAIPKYFNTRDEAQISAARYARGCLATAIQNYYHNQLITTGAGRYPTSLDLVWETTEGERLLNPFILASQPIYLPDPDNTPSKWHPQIKTVEERMQSSYKGAIWFNSSNGAVRFCVPKQATNAATIALYNEVNACHVTGINQTTP